MCRRPDNVFLLPSARIVIIKGRQGIVWAARSLRRRVNICLEMRGINKSFPGIESADNVSKRSSALYSYYINGRKRREQINIIKMSFRYLQKIPATLYFRESGLPFGERSAGEWDFDEGAPGLCGTTFGHGWHGWGRYPKGHVCRPEDKICGYQSDI